MPSSSGSPSLEAADDTVCGDAGVPVQDRVVLSSQKGMFCRRREPSTRLDIETVAQCKLRSLAGAQRVSLVAPGSTDK